MMTHKKRGGRYMRISNKELARVEALWVALKAIGFEMAEAYHLLRVDSGTVARLRAKNQKHLQKARYDEFIIGLEVLEKLVEIRVNPPIAEAPAPPRFYHGPLNPPSVPLVPRAPATESVPIKKARKPYTRRKLMGEIEMPAPLRQSFTSRLWAWLVN